MIILLHVKQWLGPSRSMIMTACDYDPPVITDEAFLSRCGVVEALRKIRAYENAFNERYSKVRALNFTFLSFCEFPEIDRTTSVRELEQLTRASFIDGMPQRAEDFDR